MKRLTLYELRQHECDDLKCAVPELIRVGEAFPAVLFALVRFICCLDAYRKKGGVFMSWVRLLFTIWKEKTATDPVLKLQPIDLTGQIDARIWAKEFLKVAHAKPEVPFDEEFMIGWFANSVMAGYDEAQRRAASQQECTAPV